MHLHPGESRRIKTASRELDLLPTNAPISALVDAIRPCVPFAAGLFSVIRPSASNALVSHPVGLPPEIFESWLSTPENLLQMALAPLVSSTPGTLQRDSETLSGAHREQLDVLRQLDGAGLGEGAGYKLLERPSPEYGGVEHFMLALLMERGERVPSRVEVMLSALHAPIRAAILRISLPILSHQPIHGLRVAEQSLGYICLSLSGSVIEANRRARELVERYGPEAGIQGRRNAMKDFADRALKEATCGQTWQLRSAESLSLLHVDVHRLAKETHALPQDTILLYMREMPAAPLTARAQRALEDLTDREKEVALLFARSGLSWKEIAAQLKISHHTVRTHKQRIFKTLKVGSREELLVLLTR